MSELLGKNILILGLGASGLAMARWCSRAGAEVSVADTRVAPPQLSVLRAELPQVRFLHGEFDGALLQAVQPELVFKSPGLSPLEVEN